MKQRFQQMLKYAFCKLIYNFWEIKLESLKVSFYVEYVKNCYECEVRA